MNTMTTTNAHEAATPLESEKVDDPFMDLASRVGELTAENTPAALEAARTLLAELANACAPVDNAELIALGCKEVWPQLPEQLKLFAMQTLDSVSRIPPAIQESLAAEVLSPNKDHGPGFAKVTALLLLKKVATPEVRDRVLKAYLGGDESLATFFEGTADQEEQRRLFEGYKGDDPELARKCLKALARTPNRSIADAILLDFESGKKENRGEMALVLGGKEEERFVRPLVRELKKSDFFELLNSNSVSSALSMAYRLIVHGATSIKSDVIEALSGTTDKEAVRLLANELSSGDDLRPLSCAKALKGTKDAGAQQKLLRLLEIGKDTVWTRMAAEEAARSLRGNLSQEMIDDLVSRLRKADLSKGLRYEFLALEGAGDAAALDAMSVWFDDSKVHKSNRLVCGRSLAGSRVREAAEVLTRHLTADDPDVAIAAAKGLEGVRWPSTQEKMLQVIERGVNLTVTAYFASVISRERPLDQIRDRLIKGVTSGDERCAFGCALALREDLDHESLQALTAGLNRAESRVACACALGPRDEHCINILLGAIREETSGSDLKTAQAFSAIAALFSGLKKAD